MTTAATHAEAVRPYQRAFAEAEARLANAPGAWLLPERRAAMARLAERGFPTRRDEEWRYTSLAPLLATPFVPAPIEPGQEETPPLAPIGVAGHSLDSYIVRCVAGRLTPPARDLPAGLTVRSLAEAVDDPLVREHLGRLSGSREHAFDALNTALSEDGVVIHVAANARIEAPIELQVIEPPPRPGAEAVARHLRHLVILEPGSRLLLIERFLGRPGLFANTACEVHVGAGAELLHPRLFLAGAGGFHVSSVRAACAEDASYENHFSAFGERLVRNDIEVRLEGERAHCVLNGIFVGEGEEQLDTNTLIHHIAPHATSHERYKGILAGRGRGIFRGKIHVHPDAQKTDAKQSSAGLLLSDDAQMTTMPNLEIYADDVRCTHGATIGQLDEDGLFYLRTRGLTLAAAQRLLTLGFVNDVLDELPHPALRAWVEERVAERLEGVL